MQDVVLVWTIAAIHVESHVASKTHAVHQDIALLKSATSVRHVIHAADHAAVLSQGTVGINHLTIVPQDGIYILTRANVGWGGEFLLEGLLS